MPEHDTVPPSKDPAFHTQAVYTAAHKALCTLAFALQEVTQPQNEKETPHAQPTKQQAEEEAAQRRQHLCYDGKPASGVPNGTTAHIARKRPARPLRATIIIISVPK